MLEPNYVFRLDENSSVETEGGDVTATRIAGREYTESDYFDGEHTPTFIIRGQTGDFTVQQSDVQEIIEIATVEG